MSTTDLRYEFVIDPTVPNNTHNMTLEAVGQGKRVLDVGCATGYFAEFLAQHRDCAVQGLEPDARAAAIAQQRLGGRVTVGGTELLPSYASGSFDVVVFADVLEHLVDPGQALRDARRLLAPGGRVVASIPNCAHGDLRLLLLAGHFSYRSTGLLDSTHLRFLTRHTIPQVFARSGYRVSSMQAKTVPLGGSEFGVNLDYFRPEVLAAVRTDPHHADYQYVVSAQVDDVVPAALFAASRTWATDGLVERWASAFSRAEPVCLALPVDDCDAAIEAAVRSVERQCAAAGTTTDLVADIELVRVDGPLDLPGWTSCDGSWSAAALREVALPPVDVFLD